MDRNCRLMPLPVLPKVTNETRSLQNTTRVPHWMRRSAKCVSALFVWQTLLAVPVQVYAATRARELALTSAIAAVSRPASPKLRHAIPHVTSTLPTVAQTQSLSLSLTGTDPVTVDGSSWELWQNGQEVLCDQDNSYWDIEPQNDGTVLINVPGDAQLGTLEVRVYPATGGCTSGSFTVVRPATSERSGPAYPWEGTYDGVNTSTGDKLTSVPIVSYPVRGGMSVDFTLYHNSESAQSLTLGDKWSHSYAVYLSQPVDANGTPVPNKISVHWGNDLTNTYTKNVDGSFTPPTGIFDTLTLNSTTGQYTLTTKNQIKYLFNSLLNLLSITDRSNNTISLTYDATSGLLTQISDPTGTRNLTLTYYGGTGTAARLKSVTDPLNHTWNLKYDSNSSQRLVRVEKPLRPQDTVNNVPYPKATVFTYDSGDNLASIKTPGNRQWSYGYFTDGSLLWEKDPLGNQTDFNYGTDATEIQLPNYAFLRQYYTTGRLTETYHSAGNSLQYAYNAQNLVTQYATAHGTWNYTYSPDGKGNLKTSQTPPTTAYPSGVTTTYTYTALNDVDTISQPIDTGTSALTKYTYDTVGRLTQITDPRGNHTTYHYDLPNNYGLVTSVTDDLTTGTYNHLTLYDYFDNGDLKTVTDGNQHTTTYATDALGRITGITDPLTNASSITYDEWGRVTRQQSPDLVAVNLTKTSVVTGTTYDDDDLPQIVTDANKYTTTTTYDAVGRATKVVYQRDKMGTTDTVQYGYDGNLPGATTASVSGQAGLLTGMMDGNGRTILYGYDNYDRVKTRVYPDSQFGTDNSGNTVSALTKETYTYDGAGSLATFVDRSGATTAYTYNADDTLQKITYLSGTSNAYSTNYAYYPDTAVKSMTDKTGTTSYLYDANRNLTGLNRPSAIGNVSYHYDVADRRDKTTVTGNAAAGDIIYGYDAADNLTSVKSPLNETTQYAYDELNRVQTVTHLNGAKTTYAYDTNSRVNSIIVKDPSQNVLLEHDYTYDAVGNVLTRLDTKGSTQPVGFTYTYDGRDQLTSEEAAPVTGALQFRSPGGGGTPANGRLYKNEYTYDHNENRKTKTVTDASGNATTDTYTYYPGSDRLASTSSGKTYSYDPKGNVTGVKLNGTTVSTLGWDADNRLTSLTNGSNSATYAYNGSGLRSSKTKNGTTKAFLTDGDSPASALLSDGEATYVPGVSERRGSTTNPFHFDLLGSLRAVSNNGGTATSEATLYEAFGNVVTGDTDWAGQTTGRPFGFVGGEQYQSDSESGLQLLGNRYYDPTIGRFLSSDPAEAGTNWYAYTGNRPTRWIDRTGLQAAPPLSSVTTPHGQLELAEIATEAGEAIPKPVFPKPNVPALVRMTINDIGKKVIGWGAVAKGAIDALKNLSAADINRMIDNGLDSVYAQKLADFYFRQYQYMLQHNAENDALATPLERFRLMQVVASRLRFIEKIRGE